MSVPALGRVSLPPGPSCVHHFTLITVLIFIATVASSQPKDLCQQNPVTFASQIHTIGFIDDALWAITKSDWNVYKLTPCNPANYSLVHCMEVDSPVEVNTKWPKLAESFKSSDNAKAFNFVVDNSVVMGNSSSGHTLLAISFTKSQSHSKYFGFDFDTSSCINISSLSTDNISEGLWISSDKKDEAYRLLNSGKQVGKMTIYDSRGSTIVQSVGSPKNICKTGSKNDLQVQFQEGDCNPSTVWSVSKGVLFNKQFYLFSSDLVYIFSDQAETGSTRMQTLALAEFFHCYEPSTLPHPTSPNTTNHQFTANSTHISTTAKGYTTIIIIVGVVVLFVSILALIAAYYCWCHTKTSNDGKSDGNANKGTSSPKESKVNAKAGTVSKGSLKRSQTKVKMVAPKLSSGKQSQH